MTVLRNRHDTFGRPSILVIWEMVNNLIALREIKNGSQLYLAQYGKSCGNQLALKPNNNEELLLSYDFSKRQLGFLFTKLEDAQWERKLSEGFYQ